MDRSSFCGKWIQRVTSLNVKRIGRSYCLRGALAALIVMPWVCEAGDSWSASVAATTDYVYRGVSQTDGGGAVQLGANYQNPLGWFVGVWGSNVDPYPGGDPSKELDLYAGANHELGGDFTARATYTHYAYIDDPRMQRYEHNELSLSVTYLDLVAATVSYQPDCSAYSDLGFAHKRATIAYELTGRWAVHEAFAVTAGGGYYDLHDLFGISYWAGDIGIVYVNRRLSVDLSRFFAESTVARLYENASANGSWVLSGIIRF